MVRFLAVMRGCPNCPYWTRIVGLINAKVLPHKRILIVDITYAVRYGFKNDFVDKYGISETPFLYLDGFVLKGRTLDDFGKNFLLGYLNTIGDL